jgi:hypothetical protein
MVKLSVGVAVNTREGVYHARLRRLGTEGRWGNPDRSFESIWVTPSESTKRFFKP